jgi:hypothetical protein
VAVQEKEVTAGRASWYKEELHDLYCSSNIMRVLTSRAMRGAYRFLARKPERRKLLGRPRPRCGDNIKIGLKELGCEGVDWIDLAQGGNNRQVVVHKVINLRVP